MSQLIRNDPGRQLLIMDVVLTPSVTPAESQHLPFDDLHVNAESAPHRRHLRYTSPDLLSPRSPRRVADAGATPARASPNHDEGSHTSPPTSSLATGHFVREEPTGSDIVLEVNGQNHDRMETEMETDSEPDHQPNHGPGVLRAPPPMAAQDADDEIMDMTPDSPTATESQHHLDAGNIIWQSRPVGESFLR